MIRTRGAALVLVAAFGCAPFEIEDQRRELLSALGSGVVLPLYGEFESRSITLDEQARELCDAPDEDGVERVRAAWWDARTPWKQAEVFAFGPYKDEPWRLGPKIDFWPARPDTIDQVLAGTDPVDASAVAEFGAPARGLPAIEYLIHPPDLDLVSELSSSARRCEYLGGLTADLVARAGEMRAAWAPEGEDYLGELTEAGRSSRTFTTLHMAVGEVVNRMGFTLENMRGDKLGKPLGSGGVAAPDAAESRFSGRSLDDLRDNLAGIARVYFGSDDSGGIGLSSYLRARGKNFDALMIERLDAANAALDAVPPPLTSAVSDDPRSVERAIDTLAALGRLIQVDIINALALSVGFNDNDGD